MVAEPERAVARTRAARRPPTGDREHNEPVTVADRVAAGEAALAAGSWEQARVEFSTALAEADSATSRFGLASALWWLDEVAEGVHQCTTAYRMSRDDGDVAQAVRCAVWLAITYKANFGNAVAGDGWARRAESLLPDSPAGPLHGWAWIARAYRQPDLVEAERLTSAARHLAREAGDVDLELVALAQLGLIRVGRGDTTSGFAMIDEAMAAVLAGEPGSLDTTVYACCDMMRACELTGDLARAVQWCRVADDFVARHGCPFLYAECRISYGTVLSARGRWTDAERELATAVRLSEGTSPGLHARAMARLAELRVRQGRLEDATELLSATTTEPSDPEHLLARAALLLARGDEAGAGRLLRRLDRLAGLEGVALELLVPASLAAGDLAAAEAAVERLAGRAERSDDARLTAALAMARGHVAEAAGEIGAAHELLEQALSAFVRLDLPYEAALARFDCARLLVETHREAAVDHARRALDALDELGATHGADRVAAFLRGLGIHARTGAKGVGLLTEREREVLRLVGAGLSNPEIAERLHVSRKTAAHHVSHILAKLQLRNRAEAAAYASRHG